MNPSPPPPSPVQVRRPPTSSRRQGQLPPPLETIVYPENVYYQIHHRVWVRLLIAEKIENVHLNTFILQTREFSYEHYNVAYFLFHSHSSRTSERCHCALFHCEPEDYKIV